MRVVAIAISMSFAVGAVGCAEKPGVKKDDEKEKKKEGEKKEEKTDAKE